MEHLRSVEVKYLKGIGPRRADMLGKELGIRTVADMVSHFPTHYIDRSRFYTINSFHGEMPVLQVKGRFVSFTVQGEGAKMRLVGLFTDGSGTMEVVWFRRLKWMREQYHAGIEYVLFGKPSEFNGHWSMVHPEIDLPAAVAALSPLRGVYPLTDRLRNAGFTSRT